jgi:asparagine synthase (glutamine-hydrolysing)
MTYLASGRPRFVPGPWDEDLLWLFGTSALAAKPCTETRTDYAAPIGGYYTLRSPTSLVFTRCASFRHRPGQADILHVDLWWRGQNVAIDAGTYSYNAAAPWDNPLAGTAFHNTVTVDSLDQMERVGKFLWLPWLRGRVRSHQHSPHGWFTYWEGAHDGYRRCRPPVRYRRGILRLGAHHWLVLDALHSHGTHSYRLHWLFPDVPYVWQETSGCLSLHLSGGLYHVQAAALAEHGIYTLVRADPCSPRGWRAPYYSYREPALSLDVTRVTDTVCFWTLFGPDKGLIEMHGTTWCITTDRWQTCVKLQVDSGEALVAEASIHGVFTDILRVSRCTSC